MSAPRHARCWSLAAIAAAIGSGGCAHLVVLHDPLTASEHNDLGVAYESSGQTDLAAKEYRRVPAPRPAPEPRLGQPRQRGRRRAADGPRRRSATGARCARFRRDADAMNNLAIALLRQGRDLVEARAWAERAVAAGGERDSVYRATLAEFDRGGH